MVLKIHEPEAAMGGQIIRISNKDRPTSWITFHFESENDAAQAADLLKGALQKAIKVEWPQAALIRATVRRLALIGRNYEISKHAFDSRRNQ